MDIEARLEELENAITDAEERKREFVRDHPNGTGDKVERTKLYTDVERARRALRDFKIKNQLV